MQTNQFPAPTASELETLQPSGLLEGATATYSPEDNKLRLYPLSRLDADLYARVREAGFIWAPKQDLFVAPMWTPGREDLLIELCGEIEDEGMSLTERQEARADRFDDYSGKRRAEADRAYKTVGDVAKRFEFGQPILVGHHSERAARKDKERIESGMRKAVNLWETSTYWKARAAGALQHAKYKELPTVRHRRIKGIEADKRKTAKKAENSAAFLSLWQKDGLTLEQAMAIANHDHLSAEFTLTKFPRSAPASQYEGMQSLWSAMNGHVITANQAQEMAIRAHTRQIARAERWLAHYQNRIDFEKAMLGEDGGIPADKFDIQPGGRVLVRGEWLVVLRVTRRDGKILSVTTNARYVSVRGIEEVKDYAAPEAGEGEKVKTANKLPPLVNVRTEGCAEMTKAEYTAIHTDYRCIRIAKATGAHAPYRYRLRMKECRLVSVFLTDAKEIERPLVPAAGPQPEAVTFERRLVAPDVVAEPAAAAVPAPKEGSNFEVLRDALKQGVQVVIAPQLFATPEDLARRMVDLASISRGDSVLEPSAGTARILRAIREATGSACNRTAVEINPALCRALVQGDPAAHIYNVDFLQYEGGPGKFDAVVMNPPFVNAQDIKHILHAVPMLKAGGRMVAICADGPRQNAQLRPLVDQYGGTWEQLPSGTFSESGTDVRSVLIAFTV